MFLSVSVSHFFVACRPQKVPAIQMGRRRGRQLMDFDFVGAMSAFKLSFQCSQRFYYFQFRKCVSPNKILSRNNHCIPVTISCSYPFELFLYIARMMLKLLAKRTSFIFAASFHLKQNALQSSLNIYAHQETAFVFQWS